MKNNIEVFENSFDLVEEDRFNNNNQMPIYLVIDWVRETVDVEVRSHGYGTPIDAWNGLVRYIRLPDNVDARYLHDDIEGLMDKIEKIGKGFDTEYNGRDWVGYFNDVARQELYILEDDLGYYSEKYLHLNEHGGLWDAYDWFMNYNFEEVTPETDEDELHRIAEQYYEEALEQGVVIKGGVDKVYRILEYIHGERVENEMEDEEDMDE